MVLFDHIAKISRQVESVCDLARDLKLEKEKRASCSPSTRAPPGIDRSAPPFQAGAGEAVSHL